jgi:Zn-dependent protease with chaperone function
MLRHCLCNCADSDRVKKMTDEQFDILVGKLEEQARRDPAGYRFKVLLLALFGNAYLGAMLLLIVALLVGLVLSIKMLNALALKLIFVVGLFLSMVLNALWNIRIEPPQGVEIRAGQAPELFAMIGGLRRRLGAPRFHHVLITDEFNAGVAQSPRLGLFGWHRNYLLIGLPLMKSLTVEQFKAVLAHEFGHLARGHGRMSNWIYRQRLRWSRLLAVLEAQQSRGSFLFKPFLNRFVPYFNAFSFPLARANEYEADAASVRLTSPQAAAEALTSVNVIGSYLAERYWPHIYQQAGEQPQPGFMPYLNMGHHVATELDGASTQGWLEQAMARQTTSADTHPALNERLKAFGEPPRFAPPAPGQAADRLLGEALEAIAEDFDRRWQDNIRPAWQERHQEVQAGRRALAELNARHAGGAELSLQEAYDRAGLTETVGGDAEAALGQFRVLHERAPDDAVVCFSLGARLLARNDDTGRALVERAMQLDENAILQGCEVLRDYHRRNGRDEDARVWHQRLIERAQLQQAADQERSQVTLNDKFERHDLSEDALAELRAQLQAIPSLRKAYFVRKRVRHFAHRPCYVLGFGVAGFLQPYADGCAKAVLQQIQKEVRFPGETLIINVEGNHYRFGRKFRWMRGSRIL